MENVLTPLTKSVLIPLGLSAGMSAAMSRTTAISNEEMEDTMKIVKSIEESGLMIKEISETIKNEAKEQKRRVSYNVIRNISCCYIRKCINRNWSNKSRSNFLMSLHPLTNFEIQKYYQNDPKFNGVYSRNSLSKIKDGVYIKNIDEHESVGTHWIALYVNTDIP